MCSRMGEYMQKLCAALLLVGLTLCNAEVTVENGKYSVLVSFSQNFASEDGQELLENMKDSLNSASEILYNAIGLQFSKVTFEIPTSWDISEWNITTENSISHSHSKADFLVDGTNDVVFGKFPFAQQYGSCGVPGRQIIIPSEFFHEDNGFPKGLSLAREWLKYRYGVFEENGYFADPMYPLYYTIPGSDPSEVKITDCTNTEVTYEFLDQNGNNCSAFGKTLIENLNSEYCRFKPDEESIENVTSSLMYFQKDISTMLHVCGKDPEHKHNSRSPNKHNALCHGQSIWDIVKSSPDFQTEKNAEGIEDIDYVYVRETRPKVVIAWEISKQLASKKSAILDAIKKIIIDLPTESQFYDFPYTDSLFERKYTLHDLNGLADKSRVVGEISTDFYSTRDGDINLAISKAADILSSVAGDSKPEGTIIIVTRSYQNLDESLLQRLRNSNVCVKIMFFRDGDVPEDIKNLALPNGGTLDEFPMTDKQEDTFSNLFEAMETILPSTTDDKKTNTVETALLSKDSPISVQVDDSIDSVSFWVFHKMEKEQFQFKFNDEEVKSEIKAEHIGSVLALSYSPTQVGQIEIAFVDEFDPKLTQVTTTSKAGKYFSGEVLVHDTSEKDTLKMDASEKDSVQMPVIIYAFIRFGAYPVQNALVSAIIERPNAENVVLDLNDDGKGDPDIIQNDGIYSRYFTGFSEKGEYKVTITVKNNGELTTIGVDKNAGFKTCCGSFLKGDTQTLTKFSKELKTSFEAISGRPEDGYKPSRIVDLRIDDEVTNDQIILKWTAPGGEADFGKAQSYEIKRFTSQDEALKNFDSGTAIFSNTESPKERGETETFEAKVSDFEESGTYYIAIKTTNANKTSDLSNTIEVFIPDVQTTSTPDGEDDTIKDKIKKTASDTKTVGIVIGVIVAAIILIIIIYMAIYFLVVKPKRKAESKQNSTNHAPVAREDNVLNPINFIPASTIMEHHKEKEKAKNENKEPPIFKEEDFEGRNSRPTNESGESSSNNDQQLEKGNMNPAFKNDEHLPPKSPKRTTFV